MSSDESDLDEKLVDLDIEEDTGNNRFINILLLGETGVGKSTFINSVANFITYKYFDVAEENKLFVLIPSMFSIQDKYKKEHKIIIGAAVNQNERVETGESATQAVKTYLFPIWRGKVQLRIIDTPGMGDTRGIKQDEENCNDVLKYVGQLDYLHAICFLFKPTEARKTMFFEYCFSQILCRLDKTACSKLFFVFTKTRGANYGATDTLGVLETVFAEIKKYSPDVDIPLSLNSNVFCFDNEGFRCLAAKQKQKLEFDKDFWRNCRRSWKTSAANWWNLFTSIRNRDSEYNPRYIATITRARHSIGALSKVLLDISNRIRDNNSGLQRLLCNNKEDEAELDELRSKRHVKAIVVQKVKSQITSLVCGASSCTEIYKVGNEKEKHYKTICHLNCSEVIELEKNVIGHPQMANCFGIDGRTGQCINCKCDFSVHLWIDYQTRLKEDLVVDQSVLGKITEKEEMIRKSKDVMSDIHRKNWDLEQERNDVTAVCHKLASFIRRNAIIPFNYCYHEYVEQCIKQEQSNPSPDRIKLNDLRNLLGENEELNKIFDNALVTDQAACLLDSDYSLEEIESRYECLFELKYSGKLIKKLLTEDHVLIEDLIDHSNETTEYIHDETFNHKIESKSKNEREKKKDKKKDKKEKHKTTDKKKKDKKKKESEKGNYTDNGDSDASSKKENKKQQNKNKKDEWEDIDDSDNESIESDVSTRTNESKLSKMDKKGERKNKHRSMRGSDNQSDKADNSNRQRPRTPPPPYTDTFTHTDTRPTFKPWRGQRFQQKHNQNTGQQKNTNTSNDNKYEITVSIKENNRPNPHHHQTHPPQHNAGYHPRPPPPMAGMPPGQPRFPPPPHMPGYGPHGSRYPLPEHRFPPPGPRFNHPDPRFSHPEPRFNHPDPRFNHPDPRFNHSNPRLNHPEPRFNHPYPRFNHPDPRFNHPDPRYTPPHGSQYTPHDTTYSARGPPYAPQYSDTNQEKSNEHKKEKDGGKMEKSGSRKDKDGHKKDKDGNKKDKDGHKKDKDGNKRENKTKSSGKRNKDDD